MLGDQIIMVHLDATEGVVPVLPRRLREVVDWPELNPWNIADIHKEAGCVNKSWEH